MGTGDEEPLVDGLVDWGSWEWRSLRNLSGLGERGGGGQGGVGQVNLTWVGGSLDQLVPSLSTLGNNLVGVLLVLALTGEGELVLWLSVRDFVDSEPFVGGSQQTWQVGLDILDVVQLSSQWVVDVNDNDLPVSLTLVQQGHDTQDLDLLDLTDSGDLLTDLTDIQRIVVTLGLGLWVDLVWVLPGLRESTVVVDVTVVREAVSDKSQLTLLGVLDDWVQLLLLGDLQLGVSPSWDLDDHVEDGLFLVGIQWDVVERRDDLTILLDEDLVVQSVGSTNLAGGVRHCVCWWRITVRANAGLFFRVFYLLGVHIAGSRFVTYFVRDLCPQIGVQVLSLRSLTHHINLRFFT